MNFYPYDDFFYVDWTGYTGNWLDDETQFWYTPIQHVDFDEEMRYFAGTIYLEYTMDGAYAMKGHFYFNEDYSNVEWAYLELMFEDSESYWMDLIYEQGVMFSREWEPMCQDEVWNNYEWDVVWMTDMPDYYEEWSYEGDFFKFTNDGIFDWWTAAAMCEHHGGHLAVIDEEWKSEQVAALIANVDAVHWIGASDEWQEGEWYWYNGHNVWDSYTRWNEGEPNDHGEDGEDCASIMYDGWTWNDMPCGAHGVPICQWWIDEPLPVDPTDDIWQMYGSSCAQFYWVDE